MQYTQELVILTLFGMMLVTYLPRVLPIAFLANKQLPQVVTDWLGFVPAAILAALLAPSLFINEGSFDLSFENQYLWAAIPVFLVAIRTKSFFGTILTGMTVIALWRYMI